MSLVLSPSSCASGDRLRSNPLNTVEVSAFSPSGELPDAADLAAIPARPEADKPAEAPAQILFGWLMVPIRGGLWIPGGAKSMLPDRCEFGYEKACLVALDFNTDAIERRKHQWAVVSVHIGKRAKFGLAVVEIDPLTRPGDPREFPVQVRDVGASTGQARHKVLQANRGVIEVARAPKYWATIVASISEDQSPKANSTDEQSRRRAVQLLATKAR